jgi:FtsH-binding integral membrane protein
VNPVHHLSEPAKHVGDYLAVGSFLASIAAWLIANTALITAITAVVVLAWTLMRMVESYQNIRLNARKFRD